MYRIYFSWFAEKTMVKILFRVPSNCLLIVWICWFAKNVCVGGWGSRGGGYLPDILQLLLVTIEQVDHILIGFIVQAIIPLNSSRHNSKTELCYALFKYKN